MLNMCMKMQECKPKRTIMASILLVGNIQWVETPKLNSVEFSCVGIVLFNFQAVLHKLWFTHSCLNSLDKLHSLNMSMCQHDKDPQYSSRGCLLLTQPTLCKSPFWPLCFDSWLTHLYIDCLHLVLQYGFLMSTFPHQMCVAPDFHVCICLLSPCLAAY